MFVMLHNFGIHTIFQLILSFGVWLWWNQNIWFAKWETLLLMYDGFNYFYVILMTSWLGWLSAQKERYLIVLLRLHIKLFFLKLFFCKNMNETVYETRLLSQHSIAYVPSGNWLEELKSWNSPSHWFTSENSLIVTK